HPRRYSARRVAVADCFRGKEVIHMRKLAFASFILALVPILIGQTVTYDLVLRNGHLFDGSGSPWYAGDVAIKGDTIAKIAASISDSAVQVIDVRGQAIAPGFIDIHSHARRGIFEVPTADNYIRQGVTTLIEGPDGDSPVPLAPFLARLDELPKSI